MKDIRTLNEVAEQFGAVNEDSLFDAESADEWENKIEKGIKVPFINVGKSTLGGPKNIALMIRLSLDPQKDWSNNIFHNSRYAQLSLSNDGKLEMFSSSYNIKNMRKTKVKTADDAIKKINVWAKKENS